MQKHVGKNQGHSSFSAAQIAKESVKQNVDSFPFHNRRPEAAHTKELQEMAINNPFNQRLTQLQQKADEFTSRGVPPIQRIANVIQRFEGDVQETLWDLIDRVMNSPGYGDDLSLAALTGLIYRNATNIDPQQEHTGLSMIEELGSKVKGVKQMGIFLKIENPYSDELKEDYQRRRRGKKGPLWNARRISLNIEPEMVTNVMMDISTLFTTSLKNVESIKCYASREDQENKLDNIVIYVIEPVFEIGQDDNDLSYRNVEQIGAMYNRFLRAGRPAMSGQTSFSGIGTGGGHGSLIGPRAEVIATAIKDWIKGGKKRHLHDMVKRGFDRAGYIGLILHEEPSK